MHNAAIRALAFKWIRILWRCWVDRTSYNESRYLSALRKRHSPLLSFEAQTPNEYLRSASGRELGRGTSTVGPILEGWQWVRERFPWSGAPARKLYSRAIVPEHLGVEGGSAPWLRVIRDTILG